MNPPDVSTGQERLDALAFELDRAASAGRERRTGLIVLAAIVLLLVLGLAAPLDAGAFADGFVVVSGERQEVQHPQGGVVRHILVKEGDTVAQGQVLIELDNQAAEAEANADAAQVIGLEASRARLIAVRDGLPAVATPDDFAGMTGTEKAMADEAIAGQRRLFQSDNLALHAQHAVLDQKAAEARREVEGYNTQARSAGDQNRIVGQELADIKKLYAQGYVPAPRVQELERTHSQLQGAQGASEADAARARESIGEATMQGASLDQERRADAAKQLRETEDRLASARPQWREAEKKLEDTRVRAPVSGVVVGLVANTEGGVVSAGQVLMQIVPSHRSLVIEAHLTPDEITDVHPGTPVELRFPAFKDRSTPLLTGTVQQISADRLQDPKTGAAYFKVLAVASPETLELLHRTHGADGQLRPGLRAQVVIKLKRRSALSYLVEPLNQALWRSFRER
jgi:HlyD family type I secretion membrane fusion protein